MTIDPLSEDGLDLIGTELDGRYRIERYVGAGTMGSVYQATQLAVGRRVAIKVLNQALKTNAEVRERFRVEAQAIATLNHPNCITLFDFGYSDRLGALYMVVEYLDGHTLEERLALDVPVQEALAIGHQIADVLAQAHEAGILHRDLKPENVMLVPGSGSSPVVKVLDFGLARIFQETSSNAARLTRQGQLFGTPAYMSPEQCGGAANVGPAADVYALGVTLYELLGGFLPFVSNNVAELLVMHSKEPPPPLICDADPAVVELVMSMLGKDPGARPTAPDIADALREYASLAGHGPAHPRRSALPVEARAPKARRGPGGTDEIDSGTGDSRAEEPGVTDTVPPTRPFPTRIVAIVALLLAVFTVALVSFIPRSGGNGEGDEDATIARVSPAEAPVEKVAQNALVDDVAMVARTTAAELATNLAARAGEVAQDRPDAGAPTPAQAKQPARQPRQKQASRAEANAPAASDESKDDSGDGAKAAPAEPNQIQKLKFRY